MLSRFSALAQSQSLRRCISSTAVTLNKSSKQRNKVSKKNTKPPTPALPKKVQAPVAQVVIPVKSLTTPEKEEEVAAPAEGKGNRAENESSSSSSSPSTGSRELPHVDSIGAKVASSDAKAQTRSASLGAAEEGTGGYQAEETIYTANPSFSAPLVLTATFVFAVFSLSAADMARSLWSEADPDNPGQSRLAPPWKRYGIATGFATIAAAITFYGATAPARIVTRLTIRRPLDNPSHARFPTTSLITIHTPITKFPMLRPRVVPLASISLLGPLSNSQKPYHPRDRPKTSDGPPGMIGRALKPLSDLLIAPARPKKSHWDRQREGVPLPSHVPLLLLGDKASYSMAVKRGSGKGATDGAWCEDWESLERAMLGVPEK